MRVIINGIGVAGPALAFWLHHAGHEVTLVETAPALRTAGYVIDFWGLGYDIAERMGLVDEIRSLGYQMEEVRFVNREGETNGGFGVDVFRRMTHDRFTSVRRSDISATIYRAIEGRVESIFGDSVAAIEEGGDFVHVSFDHAPSRDVDLVIGADGLHSRVRQIAFGGEAAFDAPLGYHVAAFEANGYRPREELVYVSHGLPGRQISRFSLRDDRTLFLFIFADRFLKGDEEPVRVLRRVFGDAGWEWPQIDAELDRAGELYYDTVSQIHMAHWTTGRVALIGDAAACVSLMGGEGTGLAITEAYVLAGELQDAGGNVAAAFARYEERLMPFLKRKQEAAKKFASSFAPDTAAGIVFRNVVTRAMDIPIIADLALGRAVRDDIALPDYDLAAR